MGDFFKRVKTNSLLTAAIYSLLGLVLLIWPVTSVSVLCWMLGAVLLVSGGIDIFLFLRHRDGSLYSGGMLVLGVVLAALGVWIIASPHLVAVLVPRVIGVLIVIHGAGAIGDALALRRGGDPRWSAALVLGLLSLALGGVLVFNPFQALATMVRIIGVFLLVDGVSDLWIVSRVSKMVKQAARDADRTGGAVDVEFREENDG